MRCLGFGLATNTFAGRQLEFLPHRGPRGDCCKRGRVVLERRSFLVVVAVGDPDELSERETELDVSARHRREGQLCLFVLGCELVDERD